MNFDSGPLKFVMNNFQHSNYENLILVLVVLYAMNNLGGGVIGLLCAEEDLSIVFM